MKIKISITVTTLFLIISAFGQRPGIELTFTAIDNVIFVQLDSIKIMNRTQGGDTVLYYPDTVLIMECQSGDELLYIGYVDTLQSGILDKPQGNEDYTFQFTTNIPCPGLPTVVYEGQVYNTIQVFSQCWLRENLNVGEMIDGAMEQSDNGTIEKYCYNNEPDSCAKYGGLYQWNEMMQYTMQQGVQGICPPGWHLPTDEEWKVLEGAVDSQYGIGDPVWDIDYVRGYDAGKNLKATSGWNENGNGTDLFGFSGLPGGFRAARGCFIRAGSWGFWQNSSDHISFLVWGRTILYANEGVSRFYDNKEIAFSVRCLRDD
jgi:uncharacterized protein (TIGR02145 family)